MRLAPAHVIGADGQKPRILPLCAGVGLHRDRVVTGDLAQLFGKILDQLRVSSRLIGRHEWM